MNFLEWFRKKDKRESINFRNSFNETKSYSKNAMDFLNEVSKQGDSIFYFTQPKIFSLAQENNIAQKYDREILLTADKNLCLGFKIEGVSYASVTPEDELALNQERNRFFSSLEENLEMNILCKKEQIQIETSKVDISNPYAKEIIDKWEKNKLAFKISYYVIFSTKTKNISGELTTFKEKLTKEKKESDNINYSLTQKYNTLQEMKSKIKGILGRFGVSVMDSDELLNLFASYSNMQNTNLAYSYELITDCYITSNLEFKKDYMIFDRNDGKQIFARFISVKAYETENITSIISTSILRENMQYLVFIHAESYNKNKALKKVKDTKPFVVDEAKTMLDQLISDIQSDRQKLLLVSYSILIHAENLEELDEKSEEIKNTLTNQNLAVVRETLNQKPLFFSFYPSRGNLNVRLRNLVSENLAAIVNFENDILGFKENRWGNNPVTLFRHLSGSPYFFNFHEHSGNGATGHTMIIGGTGAGKTALTQFLMCNLFKYNINIFAMDKLRGMYNFCKYVNGEYHDLELGKFSLNPFSLEKTTENNQFLRSWLCGMGGVKKEESALVNIVQETLNRLSIVDLPTLSDFHQSLELPNDSEVNLKERYTQYLDSIFNHREDALNFKRQLSILNMDAILKDSTSASLAALYLFHKLKNVSKNSNKGFFIFIDELKDYLREEIMRENILEAILEIRKINGIIMLAVQNIDFLKGMEKGQSFLDNMSNYFIFPTTNQTTLENMRELIGLTGSEVAFLRSTQLSERKILLKRARLNESAILDIDLSRLGEHLRVFSSEAGDVALARELESIYGKEWRPMYLKGIKPKF